jgi:O-antigen/teichoic acid export membrane protein
MLVGNLDVLMVGSFLGLDAIAIYSVGFYIGSIIEIPTRSLSQITTPIVVKAWKDNDLKKISEMYRKTSLNQTIFGSFLFIGIWANVDNILRLLPPHYAQGKWVIFFIALSKLVDMITGINSEIIMASKYYRFNFYIMLMLIVLTVVTNYIFIPLYGLTGAAFAAALSMIIFNIVKYIFLSTKYKLSPFSEKTFISLLIPVGVYFLCSIVPVQNNLLLDIIIRSLAITILFLSLVIGLKVSEDINRTFYHLLNRIKVLFIAR